MAGDSQGGTAGGRTPWQPPAGDLPVDQVLLAEAEVIASVPGSEHNEGPTYRDGNVYWCDSGGLFRLMQEQSLFLYLENDTCGAAFAASDGSLLLAFGQQGIARITPGQLVEQLAALPMGGFANDITLDAAGNVYVSNTGRGDVLRVTPGGSASVVARDLPGANGLEVDPAGELLYVNQSSQNRVVRLRIGSGAQLGPPEVFTEAVQVPDGAAFDAWGNYWVTEFTTERIRIFSPQGAELGVLDSGGAATTNLTFGGPEHDVLYVTGGGTLRKIPVGVPGFLGHPAAAGYTSIGALPFTVTDTPQ
jgi:sugar lactone lactonase YvrE